jgi:hypothetical protein
VTRSGSEQSRPALIAVPRGGLGNQLFNVVAVLSVAVARGWDVTVDLGYAAHADASGQHPIQSILPTSLNGSRIAILRDRLESTTKLRSFRRGLSRRVPALAPALRAHMPSDLGYDATLRYARAGTRVYGFYQTFKYAAQLDTNELMGCLHLHHRSTEFDLLQSEMMRERPIVLHVRRGDYSLSQDFGLLGSKYYREALEQLRSRSGSRPVWVFSDDPVAASKHVPTADRVIGPELGSAETLFLMASGSGIGIANSSLSWWAAWLAGPTTPVVAPDPWFAHIAMNTEELLPPMWARILPSFTD